MNPLNKIMKKLFVITIVLFFSLPSAANLISIISSNDGMGEFTYSVSADSLQFYFGGNTNILKIVVPSAGVVETHNPDGWYSIVDAYNVVTWLCTNSSSWYIDESLLEFKINSIYPASTNYNGPPGSALPKGYVAGEVYNTNYSLYSSAATNELTSINVVGYEKFEFTGPLIPEPIIYSLLIFLPLMLLLRYK